jgi:hypothetical protein
LDATDGEFDSLRVVVKSAVNEETQRMSHEKSKAQVEWLMRWTKIGAKDRITMTDKHQKDSKAKVVSLSLSLSLFTWKLWTQLEVVSVSLTPASSSAFGSV